MRRKVAGQLGGTFFIRADVKKASLSAVVTRADGRVEDLGTIAAWHRNPLVRWWWRVKAWWRRR